MGSNTEGVRKNKPKCRIMGVECQKTFELLKKREFGDLKEP
jgi:hypothetical protein